jgi:hypothetical protein
MSHAWSEEARQRAFAIQFLLMLRVYVSEVAPSEVWAAVEALQGALRREPWPELGVDWKAAGLTRFWEDVTVAVRRAPGNRLNWKVKDAVSEAMMAVSEGRSADREVAKAGEGAKPPDGPTVRIHLRRVTNCMEKACQIAETLGVPAPLLEPLCALRPEIPEKPPG